MHLTTRLTTPSWISRRISRNYFSKEICLSMRSKQFERMIRAGRAKFTVRCLDWRYLQKPLFSLLFSLRKTRGIGDLASYQSSPSSGSSPQPPSTIARSSTRSAIPSSPSPVSPGGTLRQPSHFQLQSALKGWRPVTSPATSPISQQPIQPNWYNQQQQQDHRAQQHPQDYSSPRVAQTHAPVGFEAPPSTIILRPEPPISQAPTPVYQAQPAATKAPVSGNMRGDLKWPPASVKAQTEAENRARMELAKGPAVRPRRVHKDYSGFFAQHALNSTYPGYRAPPGTQYFTPSYHN